MGLETFKSWMKLSDWQEKNKLAYIARCSVQHLYSIASGRRNSSYAVSARIVLGVRDIQAFERSGGALPDVQLKDVYKGEILKLEECKS